MILTKEFDVESVQGTVKYKAINQVSAIDYGEPTLAAHDTFSHIFNINNQYADELAAQGAEAWILSSLYTKNRDIFANNIAAISSFKQIPEYNLTYNLLSFEHIDYIKIAEIAWQLELRFEEYIWIWYGYCKAKEYYESMFLSSEDVRKLRSDLEMSLWMYSPEYNGRYKIKAIIDFKNTHVIVENSYI